jgi:hypothetical protein
LEKEKIEIALKKFIIDSVEPERKNSLNGEASMLYAKTSF